MDPEIGKTGHIHPPPKPSSALHALVPFLLSIKLLSKTHRILEYNIAVNYSNLPHDKYNFWPLVWFLVVMQCMHKMDMVKVLHMHAHGAFHTISSPLIILHPPLLYTLTTQIKMENLCQINKAGVKESN